MKGNVVEGEFLVSTETTGEEEEDSWNHEKDWPMTWWADWWALCPLQRLGHPQEVGCSRPWWDWVRALHGVQLHPTGSCALNQGFKYLALSNSKALSSLSPHGGWATAVLNRVSLLGVSPGAALKLLCSPGPAVQGSGKASVRRGITDKVCGVLRAAPSPGVGRWGHIPHQVCILGSYTVADCWARWPLTRPSTEGLPSALSSDCNIQEDVFSSFCTSFLPHSCTHLIC